MKNIIICCDGTNNQLNGDLTNVVRLYQVARKGAGQAAYYDPGVGTIPDPLARSGLARRWSLVAGLAFGVGLGENIQEAYRYLMRVHEPGDRVFLFGFSRGAFTVRVLAGMLHSVGLLHAGSENLVPYAWAYYLAGIDARGARACQQLRQDLSRPCDVAFLGVWDTVGSVGMYNHNQAFPYTYDNPSVRRVRHAVSLDERRAAFRSNVFKPDGSADAQGRVRVKNVWFPGVHSDVGGGYPLAQSGLAMVAFDWIVREARDAGMLVDDAQLEKVLKACPPDPKGPQHESLQGAWKLIEYLPARRFNWDQMRMGWRWEPFKPRSLREGSILHQSVLERIAAAGDYRPANLPTLQVDDLKQRFPIEE